MRARQTHDSARSRYVLQIMAIDRDQYEARESPRCCRSVGAGPHIAQEARDIPGLLWYLPIPFKTAARVCSRSPTSDFLLAQGKPPPAFYPNYPPAFGRKRMFCTRS